MMFELHSCSAEGDSDQKLYRPKEQSALYYWPITTKPALVVAHGQGVPSVMFQILPSNMRSGKDEELFRTHE
jgi:hypothetical protein